jgi:hypothetical protein
METSPGIIQATAPVNPPTQTPRLAPLPPLLPLPPSPPPYHLPFSSLAAFYPKIVAKEDVNFSIFAAHRGTHYKTPLATRGRILGLNWDKSLQRILLAIQSPLLKDFTHPPPPPPPEEKWFETNWFVN